MRRALFALAALALGSIAAVLFAELIARALEPPASGHYPEALHPLLGWLPAPGTARVVSGEFDVTYRINALGMHDDPVGEPARLGERVLVLGDSHTFADGVSARDAWPGLLEAALFADPTAGAVYNAAVRGHGLGQYLTRMRGLWAELRPTTVIVGFSIATDLYDLLPPSRGGFVYRPSLGRVYFDLDAHGDLVEHRHLIGSGTPTAAAPSTASRDLSLRVRQRLGRLALYRRLKRSQLAFWLGTRLRPGGRSLWPGVEVAVLRDLDDDARYRFALAEALLARIAAEARAHGAPTVVLDIPYLPQVYDTVWRASFGGDADRYERSAGTRRLRAICQRHGITFVDPTEALASEARRTGRWLHYRHDGHPTAEGHRVLARVLAHALRDPGD